MEMRRRSIVIFVILLIGTSVGFVAIQNSERFFEVRRSIDLFGAVYKDVIDDYVDPVQPQLLMRKGIDAMLASLDPYTIYMDKQNSGEIDLLTSGKYGGIGVSIGMASGKVIITGVIDGYSAQRQGLRIGDQILKIDTTDVNTLKLDEVSNMVRGKPGTPVTLTIKREGDEKPFKVVLIRSEVRLKSVSFYGVVDSNIGFIKLDQFSKGAGEEVRNALVDLMARRQLKGLILDLRNNPGGLLEAAVHIAELFVPKGSVIVQTKGRDPSSDKKYISDRDPIAPNLPLAVLVNGNSASASEIVTGCLQDLDRAVIVGTNTFGKGLVQTILPLSSDSQLKITTARYYTPSGRCIQKINYNLSRDGENPIIPDSLRKEFRTADGRGVYASGGITPDSIVAGQHPSDYVLQLMRGGYFFNYATEFRSEHDSIPEGFSAGKKVLDGFHKYVEDKGFTYISHLGQIIDDAQLVASKSDYSKSVADEINTLSKKIETDEHGLFQKHAEEISELLSPEIIGRFYGNSAQIRASLKYDNQAKAAEGVLKDMPRYDNILGLSH